MNQKPIEVVALILRLENGEVLVGKRRKIDTNPGKWEFPGGKVKAGETDEEALRREIQEELEIELPAFSFFDEVTHSYPSYSVHIKFFIADIQSKPLLRNHSHDELKWIHPSKPSGLVFLAANEGILEKLKVS